MGSELYRPEIESFEISTRTRLFRECEAMLCYVASRGVTLPAGLADRAGILDVGIDRQAEIPMSDLLALHAMLAEAVRPALPRTIELLQWDASNLIQRGDDLWSKLLKLAPVRSIRFLLLATLVFFMVFFGVILSPKVNYQTISAGIFAGGTIEPDPDRVEALMQDANAKATFASLQTQAAAREAQELDKARKALSMANLALGAAEQAYNDSPDGPAKTQLDARHQELETASSNYSTKKADAEKAQGDAETARRELAEASRAAAGYVARDWQQTALIMLFFISLAGLGSCFSVLYDARKYVVEGTYDPRVGSNYTIRIALGIISGVLLAQILTNPEFGENASGLQVFGMPVLALLGGFAAQLVYSILTKLVAAAESIFDQDREAAMRAREQAALAAAQAQAGQERVDRTIAMVGLTARLETATTIEERQMVLDQILRAAADRPETQAGAAAPVAGQGLLEQVSHTVALGRRLIDLLPPEETVAATATLDQFSERLARLRALIEAGNTGDIPTAVAVLADELQAADPLRKTLARVLGSFAGPLQGLGVTPAGLALSVATLTLQEGAAAYARWKTRILDADYVPDLLPPSSIDAPAVADALAQVPAFEDAFRPIAGNMAALNDLGRQVANDSDDTLFARHGDRFADRDAFDAALSEFRRALLDPIVKQEIPVTALEGATDATTLLKAVDAVRIDADSQPELQRLFLMAAALRDAGNEDERSILLALLREIGR